MCLVGMNLFIGATVRVRVYTRDTDTTPVYDSDNFQVYPVGTVPFGSALWGTEQWWGGVPSQEDLKTHANNVIHILPEVVYAETVRVDIVDTSNPLGYVEVGRMFVGDGWQPGINMSYGASLGYESRTTVEEAIGGAEYFDVRKPARVAQFKLDALTETEAVGRVMDMQRLVDVHGEVMYIWDPEDTSHLARRSFLGRLRELNPIEHPYYNNFSTAFEVKELL